MDKNEQQTLITEIINNDKLRGSLYSTFRCSVCGKKLVAQASGNTLNLICKDYNYAEDRRSQNHDFIKLDLRELAAILNFNPLL